MYYSCQSSVFLWSLLLRLIHQKVSSFLSCIPDSKADRFKAEDFGFHTQKFPRFRIPHSTGKNFQNYGRGFPYMERLLYNEIDEMIL